MPAFSHESQLPHPPRAVWDWHTRPGAFERLIPPWAAIENVSPAPVEDGALHTFRVRRGVWWRWHARIRDVTPGARFTDVQERGPFAEWVHTHGMEATPEGTRLSDRIVWRPPLGALGTLVVGRAIDRDLRRTFVFRHARTRDDLDRHAAWPQRLRVAVTGSSGLVGTALCAFLQTGGHEVLRMVRRPARHPGEVAWDPRAGTVDVAGLAGVDAVVHLAGASIARRWTDPVRREILASRVDGTTTLAHALANLPGPRPAWISGSAIGYYGDAGPEPVDEGSPSGEGFLAEVTRAWEDATRPAEDAGVRVVRLRTGIVLAPREAFLGAVLPLYRLGLGGPIGTGAQFVPWITLDDLVGLIHHALHAPVSGPLVATAPNPVPQREFASTLGRVLGRPAVVPLPALAVRLAGGAAGVETALWGQHALPKAAQASGFRFRHPDLEPALRALLGL